MTDLNLTPTEDLILDGLVARFRLGDTLWTFDSRNTAALRRLEEKNLVSTMHGVTENTVRASLTEHALAEHGPSWFQLGTTMNYLPERGPSDNPDHWTQAAPEQLSELPQHCPSADPQAVNAAHLLMIRMIARHLPVYNPAAGPNGAVLLYRDVTTVTVLAAGEGFRLHHLGLRPETVKHLDHALTFAAKHS